MTGTLTMMTAFHAFQAHAGVDVLMLHVAHLFQAVYWWYTGGLPNNPAVHVKVHQGLLGPLLPC
jgi:hypothetical protein